MEPQGRRQGGCRQHAAQQALSRPAGSALVTNKLLEWGEGDIPAVKVCASCRAAEVDGITYMFIRVVHARAVAKNQGYPLNAIEFEKIDGSVSLFDLTHRQN